MSHYTTSFEERKILYTYWTKLQFFKNENSLYHFRVLKSDVKSFIIKYIRDGIEDEFGKTNNLSRRHAFTAKELHQAFEKNSKIQQYSISNFHFHIKGLLKDGYLKKITTILEGRQNQAYYGRTAITFIPRYDNLLSEKMNQNIYNPLKILIKEMNPEIELDYINQLVDENLKFSSDFYYRVLSWLKDNYPQLYKSKLDLKAFMGMVSHYSFFHKHLSDNLIKIGSLIDLDDIMNYKKYEIEKEE